jgi:hypothetical protein
MGLDMYAYATASPPATPVDFTDEPQLELHYWRKHPDLHGWMEILYRAKGGTEQFNCANVVLTSEDLDELEKVIRARNLPDTTGFFFGDSVGSEQDDDLSFVAKSRAAIARGLYVYYTSWW